MTMEFKEFIIINAHVPSAGEGLKDHDHRIKKWDVDFHFYINELKEIGKPIVVTGDMNVVAEEIDHFAPKGKESEPGYTPNERANFSCLLDFGFVDTFRRIYPRERMYTYWP
jgi:exodeoxyribonuclease III